MVFSLATAIGSAGRASVDFVHGLVCWDIDSVANTMNELPFNGEWASIPVPLFILDKQTEKAAKGLEMGVYLVNGIQAYQDWPDYDLV